MKMKTTNLYLLRHGKTLSPNALNGQTDVGVALDTQQTISQAWQQRGFSIANIMSSPLSRCFDLASILSTELDLPVLQQPLLSEMNFGDVDGIEFSQLTEQWSILESFWQDPANNTLPNAESLAEFRLRVLKGWEQVLGFVNKEPVNKEFVSEESVSKKTLSEDSLSEDILIVTHGGVIRMILAALIDINWQNSALYSTLSIDYGSLTHISISWMVDDETQELKESESLSVPESSLPNLSAPEYFYRVHGIGMPL